VRKTRTGCLAEQRAVVFIGSSNDSKDFLNFQLTNLYEKIIDLILLVAALVMAQQLSLNRILRTVGKTIYGKKN